MSALRRWVVLSLGFVLLLSGTAAYDAVTLTRTANVDVATNETTGIAVELRSQQAPGSRSTAAVVISNRHRRAAAVDVTIRSIDGNVPGPGGDGPAAPKPNTSASPVSLPGGYASIVLGPGSSETVRTPVVCRGNATAAVEVLVRGDVGDRSVRLVRELVVNCGQPPANPGTSGASQRSTSDSAPSS